MNEVAAGDGDFRWGSLDVPYAKEQGAACRAYKRMAAAEWQCKQEYPVGDANPAAPPTYKMMVDNLAAQIYEHAPVRQVVWGQQEAQDLTGHRLKAFLIAGVE